MKSILIDRFKFMEFLKRTLGLVGLLTVTQRIRTWMNPVERYRKKRFAQFKRKYSKILGYQLNNEGKLHQKTVLVCAVGYPAVEPELALIKTLEMAGYVPVVLTHQRFLLDQRYYQLAVRQILFWEDFYGMTHMETAKEIIDRCSSIQELITITYEQARVGLFAIAKTLRVLRLGSIDLHSSEQRQVLIERLALSMRYARATQNIVDAVHPHLVLFVDGVYSPEGEFVDVCVANGIEAICWHAAHKNNALMLKRYTYENKNQDRASLSQKSWQFLLNLNWTDRKREQLQRELHDAYTTGSWYCDAGTQFNKRFLNAEAVKKELGLDPTKKTAFIFPHIMWDASLSRGSDLFRDYQEWLVETVQAACRNNRVNWVIKIHPAHVGKAAQDGFKGEPAEVVVLRQYFGVLPPHVFFMPPDSPISTYSIFALMDYCLTVRGTIGIEAARLGIPVLTSGTGRYDHRGFTIDSETRAEYLARVGHIEDIPRLSTEQQEKAERFAYGIFVLRPLPLTTISMEYNNPKTFMGDFRINIKTKEDWYNAKDLRAFANWVVKSVDADYLAPE
jgi:hypothetical protein